jgi:transposase
MRCGAIRDAGGSGPPEHVSRQLERSFDLGFARDLVREVYADTGPPAIHPVIFFTRQLILVCEGRRSERQLMQVVADRLSLRWYLGDDLTELLPDHSSLTRSRDRYGLETFRPCFEVMVGQCLHAGVVWGKALYSTPPRSRPMLPSTPSTLRFAVEAHVSTLFAAAEVEEPGDDNENGEGPTPLPVPVR